MFQYLSDLAGECGVQHLPLYPTDLATRLTSAGITNLRACPKDSRLNHVSLGEDWRVDAEGDALVIYLNDSPHTCVVTQSSSVSRNNYRLEAIDPT